MEKQLSDQLERDARDVIQDIENLRREIRFGRPFPQELNRKKRRRRKRSSAPRLLC